MTFVTHDCSKPNKIQVNCIIASKQLSQLNINILETYGGTQIFRFDQTGLQKYFLLHAGSGCRFPNTLTWINNGRETD